MMNLPETDKQAYGHIDAIIFDLDGVLTKTRKTHAKAWKELFDRFFNEQGNTHSPMSEGDYMQYIDGKPRYAGVKSFLASRGIRLPEGHPDDAPGFDNVCALGNLKNKLFNELLDSEGVEEYPQAVAKLKAWRGAGIKTAIVSSSKNCQKVLQAAGLQDLFDARVDGVVSEEMALKGKPDPDIFTEAAGRLKARPENTVVFEDALSGVKAGQRGFFGLVVGVNRFNMEKELLANGADIVIDDFSGFELSDESLTKTWFDRPAEPVFPFNKGLFERLAGGTPLIFLDYDGTLTPIVSRPADAVLSDEMRKTLKELSGRFTVAIVTGRDKEDVEDLVGLKDLIYAGSHGYVISGPGGLDMEHPDTEKIVARLDALEEEVSQVLEEKTKGTQLDRKRYAIGIHYRNARPGDEQIVRQLADDLVSRHSGFRTGEGKKIVEIKPDLDWHKGKAVEWIMDALELKDRQSIIPVFIGDDITDEDAFEALSENGIGILVGHHGKETAAGYSLKNVYQVRAFFNELLRLFNTE